MIRFLILLTLLISSAYGQERFLKVCNEPHLFEEAYGNDIKWLKYYYKTESCDQLVTELSKVTSFNEFMVPHGDHDGSTEKYNLTWRDAFPYLVPLTQPYNIHFMPTSLGFYPDETNVFVHPDLYAEFENITVLDLAHDFNFKIKDICNINKELPFIDTVVVDRIHHYELENKCKDISKIPWLIVTVLNGANNSSLYEKIIGIYEFGGSLKDLSKFRHLRYLGIHNSTIDNDFSFIGKNINLTHVSLHISMGVSAIEALRELKNLEFLTITCFENATYENQIRTDFTTCNRPFLKDITFLAQLPWLQELNLMSNGLTDVSVIPELKRLRKLNLSYNNISLMPDLSGLKELKVIDISHNPVSNLDGQL